MRARVAVMLAVLGVAPVVACSDDDADGDTATDTTASVATFCDRATLLIAGNRSIDLLGSDSPADEVQAAFTELRAAYDRLEGAAPADIADDVAATAEAFEEVIESIEAADYDLAAVDLEAYTPARERYVVASEDVEAYLARTC